MPDEPIIRLNGNNTPAIRGTRLTVYSIMDHYFSGDTMERIAEVFRIPVEEAEAAAHYIDGHMAELMPSYRRMLQRDREGDSPEVRATYAASHARLMARKAELERKAMEGSGDARIAG